MSINIKASNTTLTDAIKRQVHDKLSVLDDFLKPEDNVHVEIEVDAKHTSGDIYHVDVNIQPHNYYAKADASDMYAAIDLVIPKIREQMVRQKDKKISLRRKFASWFKRSE